MLLEPGKRVGPYVIARSLGAGGMGEVYEARDSRLDRKVALKTLRHEALAEPEARRRFEREARSLSSLSHPGICTVFDVGQHDGIHYIVMELVDGETLSAVLERTAIDERTLVSFAARIADALAEAHEHGVLHRDVKPQNIMVTRQGAKLLDFGLAARLRRASPVSP